MQHLEWLVAREKTMIEKTIEKFGHLLQTFMLKLFFDRMYLINFVSDNDINVVLSTGCRVIRVCRNLYVRF